MSFSYSNIPFYLFYFRRAGYLTDQSRIMTEIQDEIAAARDVQRKPSPFAEALERSDLAKELKKIFDDVSHSGEFGKIVHLLNIQAS